MPNTREKLIEVAGKGGGTIWNTTSLEHRTG